MSIVGPRPERPEIAAEYEKEMPEFRLRLQAIIFAFHKMKVALLV